MRRLQPAAAAAVPTRPQLTVDLDAVAVNTRLFARRTTGEVMAVVKADGFGHGAAEVARTALTSGATRLGVTSLDEAFALREAGLMAPVLSWLNPLDADWAGAVLHDVEVAVPSREHLEAVSARGRGARVHLHLDTGMGRDGAAPSEWAGLCRAARRAEQRGELAVVGLMGHLACADAPEDPANLAGRTRFAWGLQVARGAGLRPTQRHLAATSATLLDPLAHHTMSRVGAGLVGIDPSRSTDLRPALTLTAPIVGIRSVRAGTPVGYGHAWSAPRATRLALLPLGYADGLPRSASGRAEVLVSGRRVPVVGRISMDMTVVDLGDTPAGLGDLACIFGPGRAGEPTVRDWADAAGVLEHELVTGIGRRVERVLTLAPTRLRGLS
ncbi:MAG: alanine racemase [Marmoricola sp.]